MTFRARKFILLLVIVMVLIASNAWDVAAWLDRSGVVGLAGWIRREYLTGTAITVVLAMLFLLAGPAGMARPFVRRCGVCGRLLLASGKYCGKCGCKL